MERLEETHDAVVDEAERAIASKDLWCGLPSAGRRCYHRHRPRRGDWRRGKRLSKNERRVQWTKPKIQPLYLSAAQWAELPEQLTLRLVRIHVTEPGFRTRQVILATTLLDASAYPADALAQLYRLRWDMELSLRHLKTTLQMEQLSCKSPQTLQRELWMHFFIYNLVRRLMLEAARQSAVAVRAISFAGALAATRRAP